MYVPPRPTVPIDLAVADSCAGEYELDVKHRVRVWREGARLLSQGTGEEKPAEFLAADRDLFFVDGEIGDWVFGRGEDNRVDRLIYRLGGNRDVVLRRIKLGSRWGGRKTAQVSLLMERSRRWHELRARARRLFDGGGGPPPQAGTDSGSAPRHSGVRALAVS